MKEAELGDPTTLLKKLSAQFERFQSHFGMSISKKSSIKEVESFKAKVEELHKKVRHFQAHLKDKIDERRGCLDQDSGAFAQLK